MQNEEMTCIDLLEKTLANLKISCCELFWDESLYGKKPKQFAVYSVDSQNETASSDEAEIIRTEITVSFFLKPDLKNKTEFRNFKLQCEKAVKAAGFYYSKGYEAYEKDTGYKRFDLELYYYE